MRANPIHVTLYIKQNPYDSFRYYALRLGEAFQRLGLVVKWVDVDTPTDLGVDAETRFTVAFLPIRMPNQKTLWEVLDLPHLCLLCDPVAWYLDVIRGRNLFLGCVDRYECDFASHILPPEQVCFIPHAADGTLQVNENQERPYEVVFCGACYDHKTILKKIEVRFEGHLREAIFDAIALAEQQPVISLYDLLKGVLESRKLPPNHDNIQKIHRYVDSYMRAKDRLQLIRSIRDVPVHVFGGTALDDDRTLSLKGWSYYLRDMPNAVLHPAVPFEQSIDIFRQSRIVLNSSPFFRNGSHERIFNALSVGAVPLTSQSLWVQEIFRDGEELLIYSPNQWESVNEKVHALLSDEHRRKDMAQQGRAKVLQDHTWDNRAKQILEFLSL